MSVTDKRSEPEDLRHLKFFPDPKSENPGFIIFPFEPKDIGDFHHFTFSGDLSQMCNVSSDPKPTLFSKMWHI
jgi:hypothetical protein